MEPLIQRTTLSTEVRTSNGLTHELPPRDTRLGGKAEQPTEADVRGIRNFNDFAGLCKEKRPNAAKLDDFAHCVSGCANVSKTNMGAFGRLLRELAEVTGAASDKNLTGVMDLINGLRDGSAFASLVSSNGGKPTIQYQIAEYREGGKTLKTFKTLAVPKNVAKNPVGQLLFQALFKASGMMLNARLQVAMQTPPNTATKSPLYVPNLASSPSSPLLYATSPQQQPEHGDGEFELPHQDPAFNPPTIVSSAAPVEEPLSELPSTASSGSASNVAAVVTEEGVYDSPLSTPVPNRDNVSDEISDNGPTMMEKLPKGMCVPVMLRDTGEGFVIHLSQDGQSIEISNRIPDNHKSMDLEKAKTFMEELNFDTEQMVEDIEGKLLPPLPPRTSNSAKAQVQFDSEYDVLPLPPARSGSDVGQKLNALDGENPGPLDRLVSMEDNRPGSYFKIMVKPNGKVEEEPRYIFRNRAGNIRVDTKQPKSSFPDGKPRYLALNKAQAEEIMRLIGYRPGA